MAGHTVKLNADAGAVAEIIEDANDSCTYAIIHFRAQIGCWHHR